MIEWPQGAAFLSRDAAREYHEKRREIGALARCGAHPLDIEHQRRALRAWAREQLVAGRGGFYLVPA